MNRSASRYARSPFLRVDRLSADNRLVMHAGIGADRTETVLDEAAAGSVINAVLSLAPGEEGEICTSLRQSLDLDEADALATFKFLHDAHVIVSLADAETQESALEAWTRFGWRDAADFHWATWGQPFVPDNTGRAGYDELYSDMLADSTVPAQPPATARRQPSAALREPEHRDPRPVPAQSLRDVLDRITPVYAYFDSQIDVQDVIDVVAPVFTARGTEHSGLGEVQLRSYPSGGSRHPLEAYVVAKDVDGLASGVYHLDPAGDLVPVNDAGAAGGLDAACFLKRGVQSANVGIVITARWTRHNWKYRYSRSYRMVLMEVGHAIQALNLSAAAHDFQLYYCPSMDDERLSRICALDDPYREGPVIALTLGRSGMTAERYHDTFDVEPR